MIGLSCSSSSYFEVGWLLEDSSSGKESEIERGIEHKSRELIMATKGDVSTSLFESGIASW